MVIPRGICEALGLEVGDYGEVQRVKGTVVITPRKLVDAEEVLTSEQKASIDARLAEAEEETKQGRMHGPFASVDTLLDSRHGVKPKAQAKRPKAS